MISSINFIVLTAFISVDAAPGINIHVTPTLRQRATSSSSGASTPSGTSAPAPGGPSVQIWGPLVGIMVIIAAMIVFSCYKRRREASAALQATREANSSSRELTAAQLSGSNSSTATTTAAARRQRRQRRTPSQISTRSLPAYMENPGDQEMVLVRGNRDIDDPMPTVTEDSNVHTPLLESDPHLSPPLPEAGPRASIDTVSMGSEDSQHGLLREQRLSRQLTAEELEARGEAPSYFEVIEHPTAVEMVERTPPGDDDPAASTSTPTHTRASTTTSEVTVTSGQRRSGFRSLTARLSQFMPTPSSSRPTPPPPPPPPPTSSRLTHTRSRSTTNGSVSTRTSTLTRTTTSSHGRSNSTLAINNPLGSAANLSTTSISAPLSHTLVRTAFVYPQAGPTDEQMRFISSRESMGRFGVPYGVAAQAQSMERLSEVPPPPFESPAVEIGPSFARDEGDQQEQDISGSMDSSESLHSLPESSQSQSLHTLTQSTEPRMSARDSIGTFHTALEVLDDDSITTTHHPSARTITDTLPSATTTPAPAPTPSPDADASKSVPTPPPTPPSSTRPPQIEIPQIIVAAASPV